MCEHIRTTTIAITIITTDLEDDDVGSTMDGATKTSIREKMIIGVHSEVTVRSTLGQEAGRRREGNHLRINPGIIRTNPTTMMEIGETATSSEKT